VNEQWQRSGAKITVYLKNQEALAAWLVHEDANKIVLALDPERNNLRVVFRRDIIQLGIDENRQRWIEPPVGAGRLQLLREVGPTLAGGVEPALAAVDQRRLTRNAKRLSQIARTASPAGWLGPGDHSKPPQPEGRPVGAQELYESLLLSEELLEELGRTGLLHVVSEYRDDLRRLVHEETVPALDADWVGTDAAYRLLPRAQQNEESVIDPGEILREARDKAWSRKDSSRWLDGVGDVVLGGILATVNVAAGASAGVITMLPTLGIGTVAAAIGAATSTFTGLTTLKKGLVTLIKGGS